MVAFQNCFTVADDSAAALKEHKFVTSEEGTCLCDFQNQCARDYFKPPQIQKRTDSQKYLPTQISNLE